MLLYNKIMLLFGCISTVAFLIWAAKSILAAIFFDKFVWYGRWIAYILTAVCLFGAICSFYEAFTL